MRRALFLAVAVTAVVACAKRDDTAAADSSAAAAAAAGPAPLTAAQLAGTWTGMSTPDAPDTGTVRWTAVGTETSAEIKVVEEGAKDTVVYTRTLDADSMTATSAAFKPSRPPRAPEVINRVTGRMQDGKLVGTYTMVLASKPDSVFSRGRWEATRNP